MTKQERERLQELLAKATPGPWEVRRQWSNGCERGPLIYGLKKWVAEVVGAPYIVGSEPTMSNAALITEAVNALTALLSDSEERDALRVRLERADAIIRRAIHLLGHADVYVAPGDADELRAWLDDAKAVLPLPPEDVQRRLFAQVEEALGND